MKFLIVEDEQHLNDILYDYLHNTYKDAEITQQFDGFDALNDVVENEYDLILLDVMLPHTDGFDIAKEVRKTSTTPIIMLSALSDEDNQVKGYNLGIDEFVAKPYSPKLVIKKVEAVLTRYQNQYKQVSQTYKDISYNLTSHSCSVCGKEITLNNKEWALFKLFVENIGRVYSREDLLNTIWGYDYFGDERTVDTHIKRLRKKLLSAATYIHTIYKTGYKFD